MQCPRCGGSDLEVLPRRFTAEGAGDMRGNRYDDCDGDPPFDDVLWSCTNVDCVWLCFDCGETIPVVKQK